MVIQPRRQVRKKLFELHETRRIQVDVTDEARKWIDASSHQGRLFPQALSEFFATCSHVASVEVDVVPKATLFPLDPGETHPYHDGEPLLLKITVKSSREGDHTYYINEEHLEEIPDSGLYAFQARLAAQELLRTYPYREEREL